MKQHLVAFAASLIASVVTTSAMAHSGVATGSPADCILANAPYSSRTPLYDILLNPRTKEILDRALDGKLSQVPERLVTQRLPSFATIITSRDLLKRMAVQDIEAVGARLDTEFAAVPVTPADARARCARYDRVRPTLPRTITRPALLVFDKINGFRDTPSVDAATQALKEMAKRRGWTIIFSNQGGIFNRRDLARFDAILWNNVSGDALTVPQQNAFSQWLAKGGGYVGIHGAGGDSVYPWAWYADELVGARFSGHPNEPHFQQAEVIVDDPSNAITSGLGKGWSMSEEWYSFRSSPRLTGAHVLIRLDENSYKPIGQGGESLAMGDHPIAWTRCIRNGRSFYTAIGHRPESYSEPNSLTLLENGIVWAMGGGQTSCNDGREVAR